MEKIVKEKKKKMWCIWSNLNVIRDQFNEGKKGDQKDDINGPFGSQNPFRQIIQP